MLPERGFSVWIQNNPDPVTSYLAFYTAPIRSWEGRTLGVTIAVNPSAVAPLPPSTGPEGELQRVGAVPVFSGTVIGLGPDPDPLGPGRQY